MTERTYYVTLSSPWGVETIDEYTGDSQGAEDLLGNYRLVYYRNPECRVWLSGRPRSGWEA